MVTGGDNVIGSDFDYSTVEINEESLYTGMIPGIASTAQSYDIPILSDTPQPSVDYPDPEADLKWYKNANDILYKEKQEFKLEIKVYKKIIKNLLKKK
jgi:hypothetical protein